MAAYLMLLVAATAPGTMGNSEDLPKPPPFKLQWVPNIDRVMPHSRRLQDETAEATCHPEAELAVPTSLSSSSSSSSLSSVSELYSDAYPSWVSPESCCGFRRRAKSSSSLLSSFSSSTFVCWASFCFSRSFSLF